MIQPITFYQCTIMPKKSSGGVSRRMIFSLCRTLEERVQNISADPQRLDDTRRFGLFAVDISEAKLAAEEYAVDSSPTLILLRHGEKVLWCITQARHVAVRICLSSCEHGRNHRAIFLSCRDISFDWSTVWAMGDCTWCAKDWDSKQACA